MKLRKINKKGFATKDFVIAGLLFTGIIVMYVIAIASIQQNYPDNPTIVSDTFSDNYNTLTEQTTSLNTMRETALSGEGLSFRGLFDVTFGSFFTIMKLIFSTLDLFGDIYLNLTADFPMADSVVINNFFIIGLAIITAIIIFKLINAVGRNPV